MSLFSELKRRNVLRVAAAYVAVSWLLIQVTETLFPVFGLPDAAIRAVVILLAIGFIPAVVSAWAFELELGELLKSHRELMKDSVVWNIEQGQKLTGPQIGRAEVRLLQLPGMPK